MEDFTNIVKEEYLKGNYEWSVNKRVYCSKKNDLWDLFIVILGNQCVRVASYNIKQKRLLVPFPEMLIPSKEILEQFIKVCKKENENDKT